MESITRGEVDVKAIKVTGFIKDWYRSAPC